VTGAWDAALPGVLRLRIRRPDFRLPADREDARDALREAWFRSHSG
jgi:hypothetical protein